MKNIDMSKVFSSASSIEKPLRLVCDYIDADQLKTHPENEKIYGHLDVADLVSEIARAGGVKEPVETVKKDGGLYLIAGHRRRQATLEAYEKGLIKSKKIPYIVSEFDSDDDELLALIGRNTQRHKTAQIRQNEIREITRLLKKKKAAIKGSFRTYAADYLGISETDLQRYWDYEKLADCVKQAVADKKLTFSAACEFATLNKKQQEFAFNELQKRAHLMVKNIRQAKKAIKSGQDIPADKPEKPSAAPTPPDIPDTAQNIQADVSSPKADAEKPKQPAATKPATVAEKEKASKPKQAEKEIDLEVAAIEYCISILRQKREELEETDISSDEELKIIACQDYLDKLISSCQKELQAKAKS